MKKHLFYTLLMLISLTGCNAAKANPEAEEVEEGLPVINLSENVKEVSALNLSDAASEVKIVKLETSGKSLLSNIDKLQVTDNEIWIKHMRDQHIYRFSHDGKFLNLVGQVGQGPTEYTMIWDFFVDDKAKEIFIISTYQSIKVYDYNGNFKREVSNKRIDQLFSLTPGKIIKYNNQFLLSQNLPVLTKIDNPQKTLWSIAMVDNKFENTKLFKNPAHEGIESELVNNGVDVNGTINYNNELSTEIDYNEGLLTFKLPGTDTIYVFDDMQKGLKPLYAISTNEKKGNYAEINKWVKDRKDFNYFTIASYIPTKDYIYLVCSKGEEVYTYCYDKRTSSVKRARRQEKIVERRNPYMDLFGKPHLRLPRPFILTNDITGGDFEMNYRSFGKFWVQVLNPGSSDFEKYEADLKKSPDAPHKKQLLDVISKTSEDDNPILLITVLK